jgi:hypothetical protein
MFVVVARSEAFRCVVYHLSELVGESEEKIENKAQIATTGSVPI